MSRTLYPFTPRGWTFTLGWDRGVGMMAKILLAASLLSLLGRADLGAGEAKPAWQAEWERTVEGAKKEGKLFLYLYQGDGELAAAADAFHKKYPEIAINTVTGRGGQLGPRIMAERRAEKYLADVYMGGPTTPYSVFYRAQVLEPIRSAMILPEVLDESRWWQGKHHYIDPEGKYIFVFVGSVSTGYVAYNTKLVNPAKFNSYWNFLNPAWKSKILSMDPTESGRQRIGVRILYYTPELGPEFLRRLYSEMNVTLTRDLRQSTDWLAGGKFPLCLFCSGVLDAKKQGLPVDEFDTMRWKEGQAVTAGSTGSLVMLKQAPHRNAARLFTNWFLSREGQTALQKIANTPTNSLESMRVDIPKDVVTADERRVEGVKYLLSDQPEYMDMNPIYKVLTDAAARAAKK